QVRLHAGAPQVLFEAVLEEDVRVIGEPRQQHDQTLMDARGHGRQLDRSHRGARRSSTAHGCHRPEETESRQESHGLPSSHRLPVEPGPERHAVNCSPSRPAESSSDAVALDHRGSKPGMVAVQMLKELFPRHGEVVALLRSRDWSSTPLGDPSSWPARLHTVLRLMLTSRYAMWLGWGPELVFLYNDAYREQTLGEKHPWALGRPAREVWAEIWDAVGPRIEHVISTGEATWDSGLLLFLERNGYPEETYHTFSYSPAYDENGEIRGLFCVVIEETERVIGERKSLLQRDFGAMLGRSNSAAEVLAAVEACLQQEARPIPFSLTYLFDADGKTARRAARSGIAADHPAAREVVELAYGDPFWQRAD